MCSVDMSRDYNMCRVSVGRVTTKEGMVRYVNSRYKIVEQQGV